MMRCTPMHTEPTKAVLPLLSLKCSTSSKKMTPKEKRMPSMMTMIMKLAKQTTQPHPPSGVVGMKSKESSVSVLLVLILESS